MASTWPSTLPQNQFIGLSDQRQDARLRTAMDAGPAKVRRRFSAAIRNISVPIILNGTQRQTFDTFYITTLAEGTGQIQWTDPVTDTTLNFRFVKVPQWKLSGGGSTSARQWSATLELEVLP